MSINDSKTTVTGASYANQSASYTNQYPLYANLAPLIAQRAPLNEKELEQLYEDVKTRSKEKALGPDIQNNIYMLIRIHSHLFGLNDFLQLTVKPKMVSFDLAKLHPDLIKLIRIFMDKVPAQQPQNPTLLF
jgi:hypothetical protein